ncbi:phage protein D [Sedimentibacter acidaminivorans]|uniref:Phage protein D n=1 Tax=Sedimentibacter acidaminivorans TaxID=913099 RepID=A0ABS4GA84_9FIRM|nr:hypothetical protein [Sedimentibacter acidaminivorans]MBP1924589.1 phage protein D [Sedimentibacter acidaminivorans]
MDSRKAMVSVMYQGVNITDDIAKDLVSFEYTDNISNESDSVSLTLKDEKHIWLKDWFPEKGDLIDTTIKTVNWRKNGDKQLLQCGSFFIDEPEYSGRPSVFTINAVSSPINKNFTDVDYSKVWRNITLKDIANDISNKAGLQLQYIGENNPIYQSKEQSETPDSSFLLSLCSEEGLSMKVTDSKIVIFDERDFESREVVATYKESNSNVLSYNFKSRLVNTNYAGVRLKYYNCELGSVIEYLHLISELNENSKIYELNRKVDNISEARRLAQKTIRRLNKAENIASLTFVGNVELLGGVTINLEDFGKFSGKYIIEKATHSIGSGFTTSIEARKVLEGY